MFLVSRIPFFILACIAFLQAAAAEEKAAAEKAAKDAKHKDNILDSSIPLSFVLLGVLGAISNTVSTTWTRICFEFKGPSGPLSQKRFPTIL